MQTDPHLNFQYPISIIQRFTKSSILSQGSKSFFQVATEHQGSRGSLSLSCSVVSSVEKHSRDWPYSELITRALIFDSKVSSCGRWHLRTEQVLLVPRPEDLKCPYSQALDTSDDAEGRGQLFGRAKASTSRPKNLQVTWLDKIQRETQKITHRLAVDKHRSHELPFMTLDDHTRDKR